jgi:hypothetical protein
MEKTLSLCRMNAQQRARRQQAEARLERALEGIPGNEEIFDAIVTDWILNADPEEMNQFEVIHMKEAVEGVFDPNQMPDIAENQYVVMTDAFKQFVREYYGQAGGKRKKTRKHKKRGKKTRKH